MTLTMTGQPAIVGVRNLQKGSQCGDSRNSCNPETGWV